MNISRADYFKVFKKFEETFKNVHFYADRVNLYPIIRIQYAYRLHLVTINGTPQASTQRSITVSNTNFLKKIYYRYKILRARTKAQKQSTSKVLLASFKAHVTDKLLAGDKLENPFTGPFKQLLSDELIGFDIFNIDDLEQEPKFNVFFSLYPYIKRLTAERLSHKKQLIADLKEVELFTQENGIPLPNLAVQLFNSIVEWYTYYEIFKEFFSKRSYERLLTYCYYDNRVMALNYAARELGIKTVEYQHSQQSDEHFAYASWEYNIKDIRNYFPSVFWVWRASDSSRIQRNFKNVDLNIESLVGGNAFLSILHKRFTIPTSERVNGILVALQGKWIPDFIEKAVADNAEHTWYFRLHPRYPADKEHLKRLNTAYPDRVEIIQANNLSLYELFGKVKFCITAFSGTVLEAQAFGIQNIIFGEDGYLSYRSYIEDEAFFFVSDANQLSAILNAPDLLYKPHDNILIDIEQVKDKVKEMFKA